VVHFTRRTKTSQENYRQIGAALHCGKSPKRKLTPQEQLQQKDKKPVFMGLASVHRRRIARIKRDRIERLVILPLSPIFHLVVPASGYKGFG